MKATKVLEAVVFYRFASGDVVEFSGKPCPALSTSWTDATDKIKAECRSRGEEYRRDRLGSK